MRNRKPWPKELMLHWYHNDSMTLQEIADVLASDYFQFYWMFSMGETYRPGQKIVNKNMKKWTTLRKTGAPMHRNRAWTGGRIVDKDGYVLLKAPNHPHATAAGYVREHRLVMEEKLGRLLLPTEVVHHRDDCKHNNTPDNLELFDSQSRHVSETMRGRVESSRIEKALRVRRELLSQGYRNGKKPRHDGASSK